MNGAFKTQSICESELRNQGFCFYTTSNMRPVFINRTKKLIAEIYVYADYSSSALIGEYIGEL